MLMRLHGKLLIILTLLMVASVPACQQATQRGCRQAGTHLRQQRPQQAGALDIREVGEHEDRGANVEGQAAGGGRQRSPQAGCLIPPYRQSGRPRAGKPPSAGLG